MKRLIHACTLACLITALQSGMAAAQQPPSGVELVVQGDDDPALRETLAESIARSSLTLRPALAVGVPSDSLLARVLVNLDSPHQVEVVVVDARTGRVWSSRSLERGPSSGINREEIALVVRTALDALMEDVREKARRPTTPPPRPRPAVAHEPEITPPRKWDTHAGLFGIGGTFAPDAGFVAGLGVVGSAALQVGSWRPQLWLTGSYHLPMTTEDRGVRVQASTGSARLIPSVALARFDMLDLDAGLGAGVDIVGIESTALDPRAHAAAPSTHWIPVASLLAIARFPARSEASFFAGLQADLDLDRKRYVVVEGGEHDVALEPSGVRFGALVGFTIRLAHGGGGP